MIEHLFTYGTLQPGLAPREIASVVEKLCPVGEGFTFGRLYDLGAYPGAVLDPASAWCIYGTIFELPQDEEILCLLDAYEGSEFVRTEHVVARVDGGFALSWWVYDYLGKPNAECFVASGRYTKKHDAV
jgi:gamma-glutamylcyclotransferase (GGCT)/AIG2-like uncharacterized protein YtfP